MIAMSGSSMTEGHPNLVLLGLATPHPSIGLYRSGGGTHMYENLTDTLAGV